MAPMKRILLAEDNQNDVELVIDALQDQYLANEIDVVRDGAEALDYLFCRGTFASRVNNAPVLILLDLKMPKIDGLTVLRQIKNDPKLKMVPTVMMTSSREESDLVQSYQLGVNSYIVKPLRFQQFVDSVKQLSLYWALLNESPPPAP